MTAGHDGRRRVILAADAVALGLNLHAGLPVAQAQARVPGLVVAEADPAGDAAALSAAAVAAQGFTPFTAPDPPDGLWLDVTGCAHLFGGEAALLRAVAPAGHAALADTPGAAWAVARHGGGGVVPPGGQFAAVAQCPVAALRLPPESLPGLRRLGLETVGALAGVPRGPLVRRFGPGVLRRLDQALGRIPEPITPVTPPETIVERVPFLEPVGTPEALAAGITRLADAVCARLARAGQGARRLDLLFFRVDGSVTAVRAGTAAPNAAPVHIARLLRELLDTVDPGQGVEAMELRVPLAEPMVPEQLVAGGDGAPPPDLAPLVDSLANRLGPRRVFRAVPVQSDVPERSVRRIPPLAHATGATWPPSLPRPTRLFRPPRPVDAIAALPDHPPAQFTWRRVRHRVRRADGPERIHGEWWRNDNELWAVRDYFAVEDEAGARFWLFRHGDGVDPATGDLRWFLHGLF